MNEAIDAREGELVKIYKQCEKEWNAYYREQVDGIEDCEKGEFEWQKSEIENQRDSFMLDAFQKKEYKDKRLFDILKTKIRVAMKIREIEKNYVRIEREKQEEFESQVGRSN